MLKERNSIERRITAMSLFHNWKHQSEKSNHVRERSSDRIFLAVDILTEGNRITFLLRFEDFFRDREAERSIFSVKEN